MRHRWVLDTKALAWRGTDPRKHQCVKCGMIRWTTGAGRNTNVEYKRGNRYIDGTGPLGTGTPPCQQP